MTVSANGGSFLRASLQEEPYFVGIMSGILQLPNIETLNTPYFMTCTGTHQVVTAMINPDLGLPFAASTRQAGPLMVVCIYIYIYLSIYLYISIYLSIYLYLFIYLSIYLSTAVCTTCGGGVLLLGLVVLRALLLGVYIIRAPDFFESRVP